MEHPLMALNPILSSSPGLTALGAMKRSNALPVAIKMRSFELPWIDADAGVRSIRR